MIMDNEIIGMYAGAEQVLSAFVGSEQVYLCATPPTPPQPAPSYVVIEGGIRIADGPNWNLSDYIDTGVIVPSQANTTIRIKYVGAGEFSDRIVGFDATECEGDDEVDFRYFPSMADAGGYRIDDVPTSLYRNGRQFDITFGNLWVYDNLNNEMVCDYGQSGSPISTATTIHIDMSTNFMQEVVIFDNGVAVWSGVSVYYNNQYGFFDTIRNTFHTNTGLTLVSGATPEPPQPPALRQLTITDTPDISGGDGDWSVLINDGSLYFGEWWGWNEETDESELVVSCNVGGDDVGVPNSAVTYDNTAHTLTINMVMGDDDIRFNGWDGENSWCNNYFMLWHQGQSAMTIQFGDGDECEGE